MMVSGDHERHDGSFSVVDELSGHRRVRWPFYFEPTTFEKTVCTRQFAEISPVQQASYQHESGRPLSAG